MDDGCDDEPAKVTQDIDVTGFCERRLNSDATSQASGCSNSISISVSSSSSSSSGGGANSKKRARVSSSSSSTGSAGRPAADLGKSCFHKFSQFQLVVACADAGCD